MFNIDGKDKINFPNDEIKIKNILDKDFKLS